MDSILNRFELHDPATRPTVEEIEAAYALLPKAVDYTYFGYRALLDFQRTDDDYYLHLARTELLKAKWSKP